LGDTDPAILFPYADMTLQVSSPFILFQFNSIQFTIRERILNIKLSSSCFIDVGLGCAGGASK
jgi:hypothetical protein